MNRMAFLLMCILSAGAAGQSPVAVQAVSRPSGTHSSVSQLRSAVAATPDVPKLERPDIPLEVVKSVKAIYPAAARAKRLHGRVWLEVYVSETGQLELLLTNNAHCGPECSNPDAFPGSSALMEAAIEAVRKWKFKPAIKDGKPIKSRTRLLFNLPFVEGKTVRHETAGDERGENSPGVAGGDESGKKLAIPSGVAAGMLLDRVEPVLRLHWPGKVDLWATIGKDGRIEYLRALDSSTAPQIMETMYAVADWRYRPFLLNGQPVEVETMITVTYPPYTSSN